MRKTVTIRSSLAIAAIAVTAAGTLAFAPTSTAKPPTGSDTAQAWVFKVNPVQSSGIQKLTDNKDARSAVPALQKAAKDPSGQVREGAAYALKTIQAKK